MPAAPPEDQPEGTLEQAVDWLRGYIRLDTSNPPGRESGAASYLASLLHSEGIGTRLLVTPAGRANLYARLEAPQPSEGALLLLHHMDVVPPGEGWTRDPWSGEIEDRRVWGRGAIDAKSLGIAHLAALIELRRREAALKRDVVFLAVADEETGGGEGTGWILSEHAPLLEDIAAVLNEGGSNRAVGDRLFWWGIEVAQKRPLWLEIQTHGRGGHGSTFNPRSASHQLVVSLANLFRQPKQHRVSAAASDYFAGLAPYHGPAFQEIFTGGDLAAVSRRFDQLLQEGRAGEVLLPGMIVYFQDTIQVTSLRTATDTVNVVPREASALLDIRLLPDTEVEDMLTRVREALGPNPTIEVLLQSPPTPSSPTDSAVYQAMAEVLGSRAPLLPSFITGTTDSRFFRERGVPAYGFSPFVLTGDEVKGIHGADESIPIAKFREGVETMRRVVWACAAL